MNLALDVRCNQQPDAVGRGLKAKDLLAVTRRDVGIVAIVHAFDQRQPRIL